MSCPSLFNAISDPAMILDLNYRILEVNKKTVTVTGLPENELIGKRCHEIFHGLSCPPDVCPYKPMLASAIPKSCPMVVERVNETHMVSISPIYNPAGKIERVLHISRDISKQLQAEERLKQSEENCRLIIENVPGVIFQFYVNSSGEAGVHYTSPKLFDIFGLEFIDDPSLFLQTFVQNIHVEDQQSWIDSLQDAAKRQAPWEWKGRYVKPSGEKIWFDGHSRPTVHKDEVIFDGIFTDITEKTEQEVQRLETTRQQERLKKLESLQTMAGAIAHRFNNSMMVVEGNLELMTRTLPEKSDEYEMAIDAFKAAKGASQIGSMMLSYVGQQPLKVKELNLARLVSECVTGLNNLFSPEISLKFSQPDQPIYCSLDQLQIKEVVESILTNAVESLEREAGTIEISFGTEFCAFSSVPAPFQSDHFRDGMFVFCQIKDSGHGISPENMSRIFEPFYTSKLIGRGLGLALTVGIMRRHHGAITVENSPAGGTTFKVLLPTAL